MLRGGRSISTVSLNTSKSGDYVCEVVILDYRDEGAWRMMSGAGFLGLEESIEGPWNVVILPIPFEMTTSWIEGTKMGPSACIDASSQVELYDPLLSEELPVAFHSILQSHGVLKLEP